MLETGLQPTRNRDAGGERASVNRVQKLSIYLLEVVILLSPAYPLTCFHTASKGKPLFLERLCMDPLQWAAALQQ